MFVHDSADYLLEVRSHLHVTTSHANKSRIFIMAMEMTVICIESEVMEGWV